VVEQNWDHREFKSFRDAFPEGVRDDPLAFERHVRECTEKDVKVSYLKNLQGYLWQTLYSSGAIKTPIYPDVLPCLRSWYDKNILVAIYSSGSVSAQKLFFQHTNTTEGDLGRLIVEYFDTLNAGPKTDAQSYKNIASALKVDAEGILFLSDSVKEVTAAHDADMKSVLVVRAGNVPLSEVEKRDYANIESFNDLDLDTARS
ncbi:MAG: enolase-phosphatase E1, partial [Candelina submexicana]